MNDQVPVRFHPLRSAILALLALSCLALAPGVPAADPAPAAGPWLATQAMGTTLASTLAAAKIDLTWLRGVGLDDGGFCLVGVHLAKGSVYTGQVALKKFVKYRMHAYAGSTCDAALTLLDSAGHKVSSSTPRGDAGAVLDYKPKVDGTYTVKMTYAGSQSGPQACAYVLLREGGAPVTGPAIESTMLSLMSRIDAVSAANPGAHFLPTDGQVAAVATVLQPNGSRTLDAVAFPAGSHCVVAVADSAASDIRAQRDWGNLRCRHESAGSRPTSETVQFQSAGTYSVKFANAASPGPTFVVGLLLTSGGSAVAAVPSPAPRAVPAFARPMNQAVQHGLAVGAFLAAESENRLADGPSIMGGILTDGEVFKAPRVLLPGITYTIVACGDEGVAQVQLSVLNVNGAMIGELVEGTGFSAVTFKPQTENEIYTIQVKQVKSAGGSHACAALTFRQAGAGISYTEVRQGLDNINASFQKLEDAGGGVSFNDVGGQVSFYGTMLSDQESEVFTGIGVPVGDHLFVAAADEHCKDLDLVVSSNDQVVLAKDKDVSPAPIVPYNGVGTVSVKIMNKKTTATSMTMLGILNVPGPK